MPGLVVRPRARILQGHDWVYGTEVLKVFGDPPDGAIISLKDGRDRLLGSAIYNSKSQIVARRFSRRRQDLDAEFFARRVTQAARFRAGRASACRLVWSEADGLPGVIADRYGDVIVLQTLTLGMDLRKHMIVDALAGLGGVQSIVERNDAAVRTAEGLPAVSQVLLGADPGEHEVEIGGVRFLISFLQGQKTGFYLDQVENYGIVAGFSRDRRVLDCFANQGGFALACARAGASEVIAVESSAGCLRRIEENARRNDRAVGAIGEDVFDFLKEAERRGRQFDLIILDPPSFTRARGRINEALRGYRDLHALGARVLAPGGILATFSCSHHVSAADFEAAVREGFAAARRSARVLQRLTQAPDHPVLLHLPETSYLKGLLLESVAAR